MPDQHTEGWIDLAAAYQPAGLLSVNTPFIDALARCRGKMVYLATPYSREVLNYDGRWCPVRSDAMAFEAAKWAAHCAVNGVAVVSPVVQAVAMVNADIADAIDPLDEKFWTVWCAPLLHACGAVIVPPIAGWDRSRGVFHECSAALRRNIAVHLIRPGSEYGEVA